MLPHHNLLQIIVMFVNFIYITSYFGLYFSLRAERCSRGKAIGVVVMFYMSYVELLEFIFEKGNNALECLGVLVEKAMTALKEL